MLMIGLLGCDQFPRERRRVEVIHEIRRIQQAESDYYRATGGYAALAELYTGGTTADRQVQLEKKLGTYRLQITLTGFGYRLVAWDPAPAGGEFPSLFSDENNVIRFHLGREIASATSSRIDGDGTVK